MVADWPVTLRPSSRAFANAIFHGGTSPQRSSFPRADASRDASSAPIVSARVLRLPAFPFSALKRSSCMLPPLSSVPAVPSRPQNAQPSFPRCSGGLRDSGPLPCSSFPSISEYLPCFRDWLDAQQFAAIPGGSSLRGHSGHLASTESPLRPRGVNIVVLYALAMVT